MTDFEKELAIHDYLVDWIEYDQSTVTPKESFTMYGALVKRKAVCHGYAESFAYLCGLAGVPARIVIGQGLSDGVYINHAWNMVTLDGENYMVDVTWNDPIYIGGGGEKCYAYFNVTDEQLAANHNWNRSDYPKCTATTYNYFNYYGMVVYGVEGITTAFASAIAEGKTNLKLKVEGTDLTQGIVKEIAYSVSGWKTYRFTLNEAFNILDMTITY